MTDTSTRTTLGVIGTALGLALAITAVATGGLSGCDDDTSSKMATTTGNGGASKGDASSPQAPRQATQVAATVAPTQGLAVLPTTSTSELFAAREAWGSGAPPRKIEAPLAAGSVFPLPMDKMVRAEAPTGETIVHALVATPPAQLTAIPGDQIAAALKALLAERESWLAAPGRSADGGGLAVLPTTSTEELIKARAAWGPGPAPRQVAAPLAKGAVSPLPQDAGRKIVAPTGETIVHALVATPVAQLTPVPAEQIGTSLAGLLAERESWGTAPSSSSGGNGGFAVLPTTSTEALISAREAWGPGPAPRKVAAPLARGAVSPLPKEAGRKIVAPTGETIVHALVATPVAQLTPVPAEQIATSLAGLLAERESWGTTPYISSSSAVILPTKSLEDLLAARADWGPGPAPRKVAAPLAKGAAFPLPKEKVRAVKSPAAATIVHPYEQRPVPEVAAIAPDAIDAALKSLLAIRQSWGTEPSKTIGYPYLPTSSTEHLITVREAWGAGPAPRKIAAPLARGASFPLPKDAVQQAAGPAGDPIIRPYEPRPVAQVTGLPEADISAALKALLDERASWGASPSSSPSTSGASTSGPATSGASAPGASGGSAPEVSDTVRVAGYPALPTADTGALFALRESWGIAQSGGEAARPPLATGAVWPLPKDEMRVSPGPSGEVIVHALQSTPPATLSAIPQGEIAGALQRLLAEREGWLKAPAAAKPAAVQPQKTAAVSPRSAEAESCEANLRAAAAKGAILFELGSARIDRASTATLAELGRVAKSCKTGRIRVEGHTDATGRAPFNQRLSEQRAKSVADALAQTGVARDRIEAVGFGQDRPVADNGTAEGRAKNRRIEFVVTE